MKHKIEKLTRVGIGVSKKPLARTPRSVSIHVNTMPGGTPTELGVDITSVGAGGL